MLALAPLAFLAVQNTRAGWLPGGTSSGAVLALLPGVAAAALASCLLVWLAGDDDAAALAGCAAGPMLLVPLALRSLEYGVSWRLAGPVPVLLALLAGGALMTIKRSPRPALALAGVAILVVVPAVAVGLHEYAYAFEDWPCSSANLHLRLQPWTRVLLLATSLGLLVQAGVRWVRGRTRALAVALSVVAVLVQVPAGYQLTRSGCGGALIETANLFAAGRVLDPGCPVNACYCGVTYDRFDRPSLLRRSAGPARLLVPAWLIAGDRAGLEFMLVSQDAPLLPPGQCVR